VKPTRPNWSRPLPRPLVILDDGKEFLRLTTLADVRDFLKHIPKERRQFDTWQHVEAELKKAAAGGDTKRPMGGAAAGADVGARRVPAGMTSTTRRCPGGRVFLATVRSRIGVWPWSCAASCR
jgi:hypothetical protein